MRFSSFYVNCALCFVGADPKDRKVKVPSYQESTLIFCNADSIHSLDKSAQIFAVSIFIRNHLEKVNIRLVSADTIYKVCRPHFWLLLLVVVHSLYCLPLLMQCSTDVLCIAAY